MRVTAVQFAIAWENPAANHARVRQLLDKAPATELIVLPEMFATGFSMNAARTEDTGATHEFLATLARERRAHVLAGFVRNRQNQAVLFNPEGEEIGWYAKQHLFPLAGEPDHYRPGTDRCVLAVGEFQLLPAICYDLRFPELFRGTPATLIVVIANWPAGRVEHWRTLLKARAIENQAYVVGVNRCGRDPQHEYPGRSQIISPLGDVLAEAGSGEELCVGELDAGVVGQWRREFPSLPDVAVDGNLRRFKQ
jgi:predicted amidohydrolase